MKLCLIDCEVYTIQGLQAISSLCLSKDLTGMNFSGSGNLSLFL